MDQTKNYTHFSSYGGVFFRKSQSFMKSVFKHYDLTFVDSIILINVCSNPGIIQEKIAENLALDNAVVARSLKIMETNNLVCREFDNSNLRIKKVTSTPSGDLVKSDMDKIMNEWNNAIFKGMSDEKRDDIINAMELLHDRALEIDVDSIISDIAGRIFELT